MQYYCCFAKVLTQSFYFYIYLVIQQKVECSVEASKQEVIDLPQSSSSVVQPAYKIPQQPAELSQKWSVRPPSSQENDSSNSMRYNLSSLSPKLRFLLPLCNQRWRLVQELLHTTELSAPDYMPVITVDRRVPLIERHADSRNSVFLQVYYELRGEKLHFRSVSMFWLSLLWLNSFKQYLLASKAL